MIFSEVTDAPFPFRGDAGRTGLRTLLFSWFCFLVIMPMANGYGLRQWPSFEAFSDNKKFVAELKYGASHQDPQLIVSSRGAAPRREQWRWPLNPKMLPTKAFVSDNGEVVVTMNGGMEPGYGDEVVVFYSRAGQKANYSLEEFAPLKDAGPKENR